MLSKARITKVRQLQQKKYRDERGLFVAEGATLVSDLLQGGMECVDLFTPEEGYEVAGGPEPTRVSAKDMRHLSLMSDPAPVVGVFRKPTTSLNLPDLKKTFVLALDAIRDPGNLGTIIRTADWFGISHILCTTDTVDAYNPKVVQSSMGSIARVQVHYGDLKKLIPVGTMVLGAVMKGDNIYELKGIEGGVILIGNESRGISDELMELVTRKITIPRFRSGSSSRGPESLNASVAAGIICAILMQ